VTLSNPVNATIATATATGTVLNDDPSSGLAVNVGDATISEGNSGLRRLKFTVALSDPASAPVTVDYATAAATATPGDDYVSNHGTVKIDAGATTGSLTIVVRADAAVETAEGFTVTLSNPSAGVTLGRATGTGTILNDD
jgi:Calx-beta domain